MSQNKPKIIFWFMGQPHTDKYKTMNITMQDNSHNCSTSLFCRDLRKALFNTSTKSTGATCSIFIFIRAFQTLIVCLGSGKKTKWRISKYFTCLLAHRPKSTFTPLQKISGVGFSVHNYTIQFVTVCRNLLCKDATLFSFNAILIGHRSPSTWR